MKIEINSKKYEVQAGERLWDVLIRNSFVVDHYCGGKGSCRKCLVWIDGKNELACQYTVKGNERIIISENNGLEENIRYVNNKTDKSRIILDIGTTTLVMGLIKAGEDCCYTVNAPNPQRAFGADIISRIEYASRNGVGELQKALVSGIKKMMPRFSGESHFPEMFVSGNATMLHILAGINPAPMGVAPYEPVFLDEMVISGKAIGLDFVDKIILLPSFSAFVGADIVAGINAAGMPENNKYKILVDLGTNAEIALYSQDDCFCTSAAAGPCFEGANISCGTGAYEGAIYSFEINDKASKNEIKVFGDVRPKGLCASGLIDAVAELLRIGIIDETGYMQEGFFEIAEGITLKQQDIRQFQLAKSAIYSGISALIKNAGIGFEDVQELCVSGGFSQSFRIENAVKTGLLPEELKDKCIVINNSSFKGALKYSYGYSFNLYKDSVSYVDLSSDENFSRLFINNMEFKKEL